MIKGFFLKTLIKVVKKKKGQEGLKILREKMGDINFSAFKSYPMTIVDTLGKAACEIIFGEWTDQKEIEFGKLSLTEWMNSSLGKTMMAFVGNDPMKISFAAPRIVNTMSSGMDVNVEKLADNKVKITIKNIPLHVNHYIGVFEAIIIYFGYKPNVTATILAPRYFEYIVEWL